MVQGLHSYEVRSKLHTLILQHSLSNFQSLVPSWAVKQLCGDDDDSAAAGSKNAGGTGDGGETEVHTVSSVHEGDQGHWSALNNLVLSYNHLSELSPIMSAFSNIETLNLSHNELQEVEHLQHCYRLQILDLSFNNLNDLRNIKRNIGNIKVLHLASNRITCTEGLERCYSLEQLDLSHNEISGADEASRLSSLPMLQSLQLTGNPVNENPRITHLLANPERPQVWPHLSLLSLSLSPLSLSLSLHLWLLIHYLLLLYVLSFRLSLMMHGY
eukprot:TRINITY_DN3204_c0_g1_i16.p1 TRINITY_DN3204_c0_g1~~TRINITY_DN3204_c0_g1_i16.p1  ORF type:complete len:306 (+),score=52.13 TRINITY_DN3204_c0_g1_i16:107-919(+)